MTPRRGKPYIWVTWLAKLLGGNRCVYSAWFKAHYQYQKFEEEAADLVRWNREHTALMAARQRELEEDGWSVTVEDANSFKLEGETAVVAGKPDLVATKGERILLVDGKTGRERESDIWQVLLYLFAMSKCRPDLKGELEGEVHYRTGNVAITPAEVTPERIGQMVSLIRVIGGPVPPPKHPSRDECKRCNIGSQDCPERINETRAVAVSEF